MTIMEFLKRLFGGRRAAADHESGDGSEEAAVGADLETLDREQPGWDRDGELAAAEVGLRSGMSYELLSRVHGEDIAAEARARQTKAEAEHVLVVDDSRSLRMPADAMRSQGYEVLMAATLEEALGRLAAVTLVLADLDLARMNGIELVARLRGARPELRIATMRGNDDARRRARDAGAQHCLVVDDFTKANLSSTLERLRR